MALASDLLADLNDRLDDTGNLKFTEAAKLRFLNRGQNAMFPKIYRIVRDSTLALIASTFEYNVPASVGSNSKVIDIEIEDSTGRLFPLERYLFLPGITDPILQLKGSTLPSIVGANIRITAALPLTALATSASTYTGPSFSEELPVIYAISLCMAAEVEQRMNYRRMPTLEGMNGVAPEDFMTASQFWMSQFELLLERLAMPIPAGN